MASEIAPPLATTERRGAVAIVCYANPPLHLIATKGAAALADAVEAALGDAAVRALVLTGGAGHFIRHAEVRQIARAASAVADGTIAPGSFATTPFRRLGALLDGADKPVIAAIDGPCMGGGLEIALACAMRIASPAVATIGLPEIRIGIFPGSGGTQRLARLIGRHRARVFMLEGRVVDASEALALGLVDEIADRPLDRALAVAERFAARAPGAVTAILALTRDPDEPARIDAEMARFGELLRDDLQSRAELDRFLAADARLDEVD